jgi:hypothetical protein
MIDLFLLLGTVMYKTSTPSERTVLNLKSAELFTKLEMIMPSSWCSFVRHTVSSHCCDTLQACGPFWGCNMLDHERMHTQLKDMARSKKDLMASVVNNYALLELALMSRLDAGRPGPELALAPRRSTPAGYATRPGSSNRADGELDIRPLGKPRTTRLSDAEFALVQHLWRVAEPAYDELWAAFDSYNRNHSKKIAKLSEVQDSQRFKLTDQHRLFMTMTSTAEVRASLCGVLLLAFRLISPD